MKAESTWNTSRILQGIGIYVENSTKVDWCPTEFGTSTINRLGCLDRDGDGLADVDDDHPDDALRKNDTDGDGFDDEWEDACPDSYGTSLYDRIGCIDRDDDGYSDADSNWTLNDGADAFPNLISQSRDSDGDGYGDNPTGFDGDACPLEAGNSSRDSLGCPDSDGDGWSNSADAFPDDFLYYLDTDGDGFEDELIDDCVGQNGTSNQGDYLGCIDSDGDGWADQIDSFPNEYTQWSDYDGDGFGDNYLLAFDQERNSDWPGIGLTMVNNSDLCPVEKGYSDSIDGCPVEEIIKEPTKSEGSDYDNLKDAISEGNIGSAISNPIIEKVGISVIILSILTLLQTNLVAQLLPDSLAWMQFMRRKKTIQEEEEIELSNLMSIVRFGYDDVEILREELATFRSDISGKEVRSELPKGASERIGNLIDRLLNMDKFALEEIADDSQFFGLNVGMKADSRKDMIEEDKLFKQATNQDWDFIEIDESIGDERQDIVDNSHINGVQIGETTRDEHGYEWVKINGVNFYRAQGDEDWTEWSA